MEYFTKEELRSLKQNVLKLHALPDNNPSQKEVLVEKWNESYSWYSSERVCDLPNELWLKIYSYLNPQDLCRCAQVCKTWTGLAHDMSLWQSVWPRQWARGQWSFAQPEDEEEEETDFNSSLLCVQRRGRMGCGDEEVENNDNEFSLEHQILTGLVKYLLPIVGKSVKQVGLAHSKVLTNALMLEVFRLCQNLEYLDISYTRVSDKAFSGLSSLSQDLCLMSLSHLDLTGCLHITDKGLKYLGLALSRWPSKSCSGCNCDRQPLVFRQKKRLKGKPSLVSLSLSGCYQITDTGLGFLSTDGILSSVQHLDMSGCMNVSGLGLTNMTNTCCSLKHEEFFYCDDITDGPYQDTASGCKNVGSGHRLCCRMDY
jgi:F-box/leucine-rich repeat protein 5